mmetsp:Transcript_29274/g.59888  ORF Transcript_29274/g.59888 Transcript_29274/m.59888 type:complete len:251 (+) Transcript_29274:49-801(+)|eukprot:CAMPEP_0171710284 /NCGR_PEP_ID=MMETSP0991-20121206/15927_1 /TAXON_ID=483369 /ORGANISM="non described non described, Strain CCMP2098" /LENGTH=250 /DNA_ID=CAMNT_0012300443 /DNA_START=29 /DNA_END=781 /DNA_ORIENTATION=+
MSSSNERLERIFSLLDRDQNSFLVLAELNKFMVALGLEPGTSEDFAAFCEQTGASPEAGLTVVDFTSAYAETPGGKLDEIVRVHGKEWQSAQSSSAGGLPEEDEGGSVLVDAFDASTLYGIDESVLLIVIIVIGISVTLTWTRLRRCWRRCHSEEAQQKRDADRLSLIGDTARQISLDLDLTGMFNRSKDKESAFKEDREAWRPDANVGLDDIKFTEMGEMVERLRMQGTPTEDTTGGPGDSKGDNNEDP